MRVAWFRPGKIVGCQHVAALGRPHARQRDEFAQVAVTFAVLREQDQAKRGAKSGAKSGAVLGTAIRTVTRMNQTKIRADDERQLFFLGLNMRAHDARNRALVGDGQSRVAELRRAQHQLFTVRCTVQEREVTEREKLRVVGQGR